jgi:5'-3' exonuclease
MRLHLVDGTFELFRAHYSKRPDHRMPDGTEGKATVAYLASLLWLLEEPAEAVTHIAVAFDNPIRSFRNQLFDGYKTEEGIDPALFAQFDLVEDATRAAGVTVWSMRDFEADDALATAAARFAAHFDQVRILTPDKDLGQCLEGTKIVQVDRIRKKEIDEAALKVKWGVGPAQIPDLLALVGDTADGIPGIAGFGERTAAAVLSRYGHLEAIPPDGAAWPSEIRGRIDLARRLVEHREQVLLYRTLATLRRDAPISENFEDLRYRGTPRAAFDAFCARVGSDSLRERAKRFLEGTATA